MGPILFYDKNCPFCESLVAGFAVGFKSTPLRFAPLDGSTAHQFLKFYDKSSLIYYDPISQKKYKKTKAILACFMVFHPWLKFIMPLSVFIDPFYFVVSKMRFLKFFKKKRELHGPSFLP
jgi:predicted DCC family thiol-disulfide oxidoreductase YuxK